MLSSPFAALTGYDLMVQDTAEILLLDKKMILSEDEKMIIGRKLQFLLENIDYQPEFTVVYYDDQVNKIGGSYVLHSGKLKKLEEFPLKIIFADGKEVLVDSVVNIECDTFLE